MEVVRGGALTEQQPGAARATPGTFVQMRAQAGDAGAVADQQQRHIGGHAMEIVVAAQTQLHRFVDGRVVAQPATADARCSIGAQLAAQQQLHRTVGHHRGDRVLAMRQRLQGRQQCRQITRGNQ